MTTPKYQNYRVCYDNGNPQTGNKIYELYKYCDCQDCRTRLKMKREPVNQATATTMELSKVDEVAEFLKNWTCGNGKQYDITYFKF